MFAAYEGGLLCLCVVENLQCVRVREGLKGAVEEESAGGPGALGGAGGLGGGGRPPPTNYDLTIRVLSTSAVIAS